MCENKYIRLYRKVKRVRCRSSFIYRFCLYRNLQRILKKEEIKKPSKIRE